MENKHNNEIEQNQDVDYQDTFEELNQYQENKIKDDNSII